MRRASSALVTSNRLFSELPKGEGSTDCIEPGSDRLVSVVGGSGVGALGIGGCVGLVFGKPVSARCEGGRSSSGLKYIGGGYDCASLGTAIDGEAAVVGRSE